MKKIKVIARLTPVIFGGPCKVLFTKEQKIRITPEAIGQIRKNYIKIGGVFCRIEKYNQKKNVIIARQSLVEFDKKTFDGLKKMGWVLNEKNARFHNVP